MWRFKTPAPKGKSRYLSSASAAAAKKALSMNGTSDYIQLPSMTFTDIYLDMKPDLTAKATNSYFVDARTGNSSAYFYRGTNGLDAFGAAFKIYKDGVQVTNNTAFLADNVRQTIRLTGTAAITDDITIFDRYSISTEYGRGIIYDIKIYNGATLVAHYDMSTQTVQDQSGNGNHATLTGGTWINA